MIQYLIVMSDTPCAAQLQSYFSGSKVTEYALTAELKDQRLYLLGKCAEYFSGHKSSLLAVVRNYDARGLTFAQLVHAGNMYKLGAKDDLKNLRAINQCFDRCFYLQYWAPNYYESIEEVVASLKTVNGPSAKYLKGEYAAHAKKLHRIQEIALKEIAERFKCLFAV